MLVAIHQPNFAPWLGFLDKLRRADVFVLLDTVQYTKGGYQNRVRVKGPNGVQWMTVPVIHRHRFGQRSLDVQINPRARWRHAHLQTITTVLGRAPHRRALLDCIGPVYERAGGGRLVDFNAAILEALRARLGIATPMVKASELHCEGHGTRLLVEIVRAVGGDAYLSGEGGRKYIEPELFASSGVRLEYGSFRAFPYPQRFGPFVPGLSCFDYLANVGFELWDGAARPVA